jgi:hypothetical protein
VEVSPFAFFDRELELTLHTAVKTTGGKTPQPSPSPFADVEAEELAAEDWLGDSASSSSSARRAEKSCLDRDGYRCVFSGHYSERAPQNRVPAGAIQVETQTCHIIPLALAQYNESSTVVCVLESIPSQFLGNAC